MSITVYRASAGSGKTYTLTHSFVQQLLAQNTPTAYLHQLALTFTRKATEEMKVRIIQLLDELCHLADGEEDLRRRAVAQRSAILHDYGRFSVHTIDAFFQRIVRSFVWEAGLPPTYTVELDSQRLLQEAIDQVVDEVSVHPQNRKWIGDILLERIQEGRRWNVQEALAQVGKQVFDERFSAFGQAFTDQLCDKTFLSSYLQELRAFDAQFRQQMDHLATQVLSLLHKNGLSTTDFRGKSRSFMRYFDKIGEGDYTPSDAVLKALDDPEQLSAKNDPKASRIGAIASPLLCLMRCCVEYYNAQAPTWFAVKSAMQLLPQMGLAADIQRHVRSLLSDQNAVHLSQTLTLLNVLTSHNDAPFILERMGCRYFNFLLDEFQDTSVMQWEVIKPLIHNGLSQGGDSLVVGDVKQSIYRWRNSDRRILGGGIQDDFPSYQIKEETLRVSWRSREVLVNTIGDIFEQLLKTLYDDFIADIPQNLSPDDVIQLQSIPKEIVKAYSDVRQQVAPNKRDSGGFISIVNVPPTKEPNAKAKVLEQLPHLVIALQKRGFSASDIAILVRTNAEGQQVASELMTFKKRCDSQGCCFDVVSPDALFLNRSPEVQLMVAIFKRFLNPNDSTNNLIIQHLCTQLDTPCLDSLWTGALRHQTLPQAFEELIRMLGWTERCTCFPYIQELHNQILSFSKEQSGDIFSFVKWWNQNGYKITLQLERTGVAINLMTIHKAKGLEFPVVIIPFCDWGLDYSPGQTPLLWVQPLQEPLNRLPVVPQRYGADMSRSLFAFDYYYEKMQYCVDQLNVFYVAATRAQDELHLFIPQPERKSDNLALLLQKELFAQGTDGDAASNYLTFGAEVSPNQAQSAASDNSVPLSQYPSASPSLRLHTRLADESPLSESTSPQRRGIILHALLSRIHTLDDIDEAINELVQDGLLASNQEEQAQYRLIVRNALAQPQASAWFDGSWTLRNEASILLPASDGATLRPDRFMEKEGHTLIIDYKFGQPHPAHQRQMDGYIEVLQQMGYKQVEGYVWYIDN